VRLPGVEGGFGIRPGHTPLVAALAPGELVYVTGGSEHRYAVGEGFSEVSHDRVRVLVEEAVRAEQIDKGRAESELKDLTARLSSCARTIRLRGESRARRARRGARIRRRPGLTQSRSSGHPRAER